MKFSCRVRCKFALTDPVKKWLIEKTCADRNYGARPLKRALQKYVEDEISEKLIQGVISDENLIEVFSGKRKISVSDAAAA